MPSFVSDGKQIQIGGCATVSSVERFVFKFSQGSKVYIRQKAQLGLLRSIFIKKLVLERDASTFFLPDEYYIDTLNATWAEPELCTRDEAVAFATAYWNRLLAVAEEVVC